nr:retrovirus-related Pol polyprotein from transposon TNT 1-94 [Tanacetum cinerariifolium]
MIEGYFIQEGFKKSNYDHTMFTKKDGKGLLIVSLYVDDLIYVGNDALLCERFKKSMQQEFEMTDLGMMRFFLGIEIQQSSKGIHLCQRKYAKEVLERFGMWNCNPVKNPIVPGTVLTKEGEGKEVDAALEEHMQAAKRVLSDYARDIEDRRRGVCGCNFMCMPLCMVERSSKGSRFYARIMNYGYDLLIFSAYAPSMPPLISLLLSMACNDIDGLIGCKTSQQVEIESYLGGVARKRSIKFRDYRFLAGQLVSKATVADPTSECIQQSSR